MPSASRRGASFHLALGQGRRGVADELAAGLPAQWSRLAIAGAPPARDRSKVPLARVFFASSRRAVVIPSRLWTPQFRSCRTTSKRSRRWSPPRPAKPRRDWPTPMPWRVPPTHLKLQIAKPRRELYRASAEHSRRLARMRLHPLKGEKFFWFEDASDELLDRLYQECMGVFPILAEGFGLPVAESLTYGRPILARDLSVFREVSSPLISYFRDDMQVDLARSIADWLGSFEQERKPCQHEALTWQKACNVLLRHLKITA